MNILFVCTGNTCRSPMAEGLFKKLILDEKMSDITCESCGIMTQNGLPASYNAILACKEAGVDISSHKSRMMTPGILAEADMIFVMTSSHKNTLLGIGVPEEKIYLPKEPISDPYMGGIEIYNRCRDGLLLALESFFKFIKKTEN